MNLTNIIFTEMEITKGKEILEEVLNKKGELLKQELNFCNYCENLLVNGKHISIFGDNNCCKEYNLKDLGNGESLKISNDKYNSPCNREREMYKNYLYTLIFVHRYLSKHFCLKEIGIPTSVFAVTEEQLRNGENYIKRWFGNIISDLSYDGEINFCSSCNNVVSEGFCIENGIHYYCSDECLERNMSKQKYEELYDDGEGESYYTTYDYSQEHLYAIKYLIDILKKLDIDICKLDDK